MPVIKLEAAKLSREQKAELAKELTATASRIMGSAESAIYVFIKENELDNVGVGGKLLSDIKKHAETSTKAYNLYLPKLQKW